LATACPFCLSTLEDAVKTVGFEEKIKIMDVAELLALAL
jgi:Fe-S oxidoreductase